MSIDSLVYVVVHNSARFCQDPMYQCCLKLRQTILGLLQDLEWKVFIFWILT